MKTHDLAKALRSLALVLENGPNLQIDQVRVASEGWNSTQLALNLSTLAELSRVDRRQWLDFVGELRFPISIRPRDASRDILGKVLKFLENNEAAREQLKSRVSSKGSEASPELMRAFSSLLKGAS